MAPRRHRDARTNNLKGVRTNRVTASEEIRQFTGSLSAPGVAFVDSANLNQ